MDLHRHLRSLALLIFVLATYFSAAEARHHKIRHSRHKKQVNNDDYTPVHYVVLDERPDRGPWSEWSTPSSCSRSCGGGVAFQSRQCQEGQRCQGPEKRYFSCNIMDCPSGTPDLRAEQCAKYSKQPFEGTFYDWIPYTKGANKCELNCMPRGERFFNRHADRVIDGTRCDDEKLDVCVEGKCMPVGCDLMLGSNQLEDKCRVCGGDNSGCTTIKNKLTFESDLVNAQYGYNDIFLIPAGATNIYVRELNPANNYLAVRNENNTYYLNGNFNINHPREFKFSGTIFHYERQPNSFFGSESIRALGPTTEPLYIALLYQEKGDGIEYEYSFSQAVQPGDPDSYKWVTKDFMDCSAPCGGGTQTRTLGCVKKSDESAVSLRLCDPATQPKTSQLCNEEPCEPGWHEGPWGNCSRPCKGGTQHRSVYCQQIVSNARPSIIEDEICAKKFGTRPDDTRPCNNEDICPLWHSGPWTPCDKLCGKGKQSREVVCYKKVEGVIEVIEDAICHEEKPESQRECINQPCDGVDWMTSQWTECEAKCGLKKKTRNVVCASVKGDVYPDDSCKATKPAAIEDCKDSSTECEFQWFASQWSKCSSDCGKGVRTRSVVCASKDCASKVDDDKCEAELKYSSEEECVSDEKCGGEWYSGPWTQCSDESEKTRQVLCFINGTAGDPSKCESSALSQVSATCDPEEEAKGAATDNEGIITEKDITDATESSTEEADAEDCVEEDESFAPPPLPKDYDDSEEDDDDETITEEPMVTDSKTSSDSTSDTELPTGTTDSSSEGTTMDSSTETSASKETGMTSMMTDSSDGSSESSTSSYSTHAGSTASSVNSASDSSTDTTESSTGISESSSGISESSAGESQSSDSAATGVTESSASASSAASSDSETTTSKSTTSSTEAMTTTSASSSNSESTTQKPMSTTTEIIVSNEAAPKEDEDYPESGPIETSPEDIISDDVEGSGFSEEPKQTATSSSQDASSSSAPSSSPMDSSSDFSTSDSVSTVEIDQQSMTTIDEIEGSGMSTMPDIMVSDGPSSTDDWDVSSVSDAFSTMGPDGTMMTLTSMKPKICKKRKPSCATSKYGCCNDGFNAAKGPFKEGCEHPKTCGETKHGCCPDGVSMAIGPYLKGCKMPNCSETLYGCCKDNKTAASGNNFTGCEDDLPCEKTKFGCCDDGYTKAITEDKKNCVPCEKTTFGCCADGKRPARDQEKKKGCRVICQKTEFGCCPNNKTVAKGPDFEGCGVINHKDCTASYFKCCPDGSSAALGPNFKGCKSACQNSSFGCCPDGLTPAHGHNQEGCCINTPFGCCPDNILAAGGPALQGCECANSKYGCCPNGVDYAKGPRKEGCGCKYTEFGCCQDGFTEATGPDYAGCSCETFQFGCCPDGETTAKGAANLGCGCKESEFGCCPDKATPAKGPDFEGCGCDASEFGCCPDGVEAAQGEKFEECADAPKFSGEACALPRDRGTCRNFTIQWFFDTEYGGCSRFWYGGCEGNNNRFNSEDECKNSCVAPPGRDACFLPKISGPCEGYKPTWHYDTERKACTQFVYGGCLGNNNKFETREECQQLCAHQELRDKCAQPQLEGPCNGNFERWYFSSEESVCRRFRFGGCKGNQNNFLSENACKQQCQSAETVKAINKCTLPSAKGPCRASILRWYFNTKAGECQVFSFGGCRGNKNNFQSRKECEKSCDPDGLARDVCSGAAPSDETCGGDQKLARWRFESESNRCLPFYTKGCDPNNRNSFIAEEHCLRRCPPKQEENICRLAPAAGECSQYVSRWFYNVERQQCMQFYYGGCNGNSNNFEREEDCSRQCKQQAEPEEPHRAEFCSLPEDSGSCQRPTPRWFFDSRDGTCKQFQYGGCEGNQNRYKTRPECEQKCSHTQDPCRLPKVAEACPPSDVAQFYYDQRSDSCHQASPGECLINTNRFPNIEYCQERCRRGPPAPVPPEPQPEEKGERCNMHPTAGSCSEQIEAWYFDQRTNDCNRFIYTGCGGNGNRFQSQQECLGTCGQDRSFCKFPVDVGGCAESYPRFYYDYALGDCRPFVYTGCGGNQNHFEDVGTCLYYCSIFARDRPPVTEVPPIVVFLPMATVPPAEPEPVDLCANARRECEYHQTNCYYGIEQFMDENQCARCRCNEPCKSTICPEYTRCVVEQVQTYDQEARQFRAICRQTEKPGVCPPAEEGAECEHTCREDSDCPGSNKCCFNGCAYRCRDPNAVVARPEEPATRPPYIEPPPTRQTSEYEAPQIQLPEPVVRVFEGGECTLKCHTRGNPQPTITWFKNQVIDGSRGRHRLLPEGSLQIIGVMKEDAGNYNCTAHNGVGSPAVRTIRVDVLDPPGRSDVEVVEVDPYVRVHLLTPAVLHCYAMGWPRPSVTWWRGDRILPLSSKHFEQRRDFTLQLAAVSVDDLGAYTCQAYNGVGKARSWTVTVQAYRSPGGNYSQSAPYYQYLIEPPTPSVGVRQPYPPQPYNPPVQPVRVPVRASFNSPRTSYAIDTVMQLQCDVDGYPIPQVSWFKDAQPLEASQRVTISEGHSLRIERLEVGDAGTYECVARNQESRDSSSVQISVDSSQQIHPNCTDSPLFANCKLIVTGKYCTHKYYARFCCRSCTEAGQLPLNGPHLQGFVPASSVNN